MKLVFLSAFLNHHQKPLSDELFRLLGEGNYWFVATEKISEERKQLGYPSYSNIPYLLEAYKNESELQRIKDLCLNADVVIIGSAPEELVTKRILEGKLTYRYNERWFKDKPWYLTGLRGWKIIFKNHLRFRNKPLYMLAASAYTANDVYNIGAYKNKVFKWGYFTSVDGISEVEEPKFNASTSEITSLLWCGRFLRLKHPELPIKLAKKLKEEGYAFHLDMIGIGDELEKTKSLAKDLDICDVVSFLGSMPNYEVLSQMRSHDIFLFTSDRREGWGAVLNEAMSSGCAVVTSDKIGSTLFLIEEGKNGMIFKSEDLNSLYDKTKYLLDFPDKRHLICKKALETMKNDWCPKTAAERLIGLSEALLRGKPTPYLNGPCSQALPIKE